MQTIHKKGQINKSGFLEIEHSGRMELSQCIHKKQSCGDFCVGFGEPENVSNSIQNSITGVTIKYTDKEQFWLCLCTIGKVQFKQFNDLRAKNESK